MPTNPHRIFRQSWHVSVTSATQAFDLRKQIHEHMDETLAPVFDRAFNEYSKEDSMRYIPKLEIRLKVANDAELWKAIPEELYNQLVRLLRPEASHNVSESVEEKSSKEIPVEIYNFELLVRYLQEGNLPWQVSTSPPETVEMLKNTIDEQWDNLGYYLRTNEPTEAELFRLFQLLPDEKVFFVAHGISEKIPHFWREELLKLLKALLSTGENTFSTRTRLLLISCFLKSCVRVNYQKQVPNLLYEAVRILELREMASFRHFVDTLPKNSFFYYAKTTEHYNGSGRTGFHRIRGEEINDPDTVGNGTNGLIPENLVNNELADLIEKEPDTPLHTQYSPFENPLQKTGNAQKTISGRPSCLKLPNGGLLLLHPFLKGFFVQTGILTDKIIPAINLPRAAALLHFLATGSEEVYEFELGFAKILLGLDPEQPLAITKGLLTRQDSVEVETLLHAVISHWSVLKSSSINALRSCFLQRYVLLYDSEDSWKVRMESNAFDVLLDQLPWSYSIVKLPWMNKPIYTEWPTN